MKTKLLAIACSIAAISIGAGARADVIAGWDFSQYETPGSLAGGGSSPVATNSVFDGNGAGNFASQIGQAVIGGAGTFLPVAGLSQNGTQAVPLVVGYSPLGPVQGNRFRPFVANPGKAAFEAFAILRDEIFSTTNRYAMLADGNVTVDFNVTSPVPANTWAVSFGAHMANGNGPDGGEISCAGACSTNVTVQLDTGSGLTGALGGPVVLDPQDRRYRVTFPNSGTSTATPKVRIITSGSAGTGHPLIDNVAIEATPMPEPGAALGLLAGVGFLAGLRRFRR